MNKDLIESHTAETVPFHEANIGRIRNATLTDGITVDCGEGRRVEVWRIKEHGGYCLRFFRPTDDGKTCELTFGLTPGSAEGLLVALSRRLDVADCCVSLAEARDLIRCRERYADELVEWMNERRRAPDPTTIGMIQECLRPLCSRPNGDSPTPDEK